MSFSKDFLGNNFLIGDVCIWMVDVVSGFCYCGKVFYIGLGVFNFLWVFYEFGVWCCSIC